MAEFLAELFLHTPDSAHDPDQVDRNANGPFLILTCSIFSSVLEARGQQDLRFA